MGPETPPVVNNFKTLKLFSWLKQKPLPHYERQRAKLWAYFDASCSLSLSPPKPHTLFSLSLRKWSPNFLFHNLAIFQPVSLKCGSRERLGCTVSSASPLKMEINRLHWTDSNKSNDTRCCYIKEIIYQIYFSVLFFFTKLIYCALFLPQCLGALDTRVKTSLLCFL